MRKILSLILIFGIINPSVVFADRLWNSGAELQSTTGGMEWSQTLGTMSINTTTKRSGEASTRHNPTNSTGWARFILSTSADNCFARAYINVASYPTTTASILGFHDTGGVAMTGAVTMTTSGALQVISGLDGSQQGSNSSVLSLNTWYRVEFRVDSSSVGTTWDFDLLIDGTEIVNTSQSDLGAVADCDQFSWGASPYDTTTGGVGGPNETMDIYFDDIAVNEDTGTQQTSWPGVGSIIHLQPDSAGDAAATTGDYTAIDEVTPNDGTDYIEIDNNGAANYNFESWASAGGSSGDTITLVQVGTRNRPETALSAGWTPQIKSQTSGTTENGTATTHNDTTWRTSGDQTPQSYRLTSYTDPQGGGAWTPSLLDSVIAGVNVTDADPDVWLSSIWISVEYVPSSGGSTVPQDESWFLLFE